MKKILNFLFLVLLPINSTILLTSCFNKANNPKCSMPFDEQPFPNQDQEMLKKFLNQLDFDHNELEGNELNDAMKFDHYKNIVEKQILSYITDNFNPKFKVEININKTSNTLEQDKCKINCEISCNCLDDFAKKDFGIKFKNVKSNSSFSLLKEAKKKLTTTLIDGSSLDQLASIGSKANKDSILKLIKNIVNCKNINVELLTSPEMNLSLTDNKINISISHNSEKEDFYVTFKNIKLYSDNLLEEIKIKLTSNLLDGSTLDELSSIGSITNKSKIMNIFENIIGIKKTNIELEEPKKNLSQTDNAVKIRISSVFKVTAFSVKFKNVKSYSKQEINNLLNIATNKFTKPVSGTEFDDQMLLNDEGINEFHKKIATIINDERIKINVYRSNKTLNEVNNKVKFEIKIDHKTYGNKSKQLLLMLEDVLASKWHKILRHIENKLIKYPIDCKQLVRDNQLLILENTQYQIKNIIKNLINNKDVNLKLITNNKTLKDHKNIINVKISNYCGNLSRIFNVTLSNIKIFKIKQLDENKVKELEKKPLSLLLNISSRADKNEIKKHYMKCKTVLQDGQLKNFFCFWWNKIKKTSINEKFNFVYSSLQKTVFDILDSESFELETIFKNLNSYDDEILSTNEDVNQFYRYLERVNQIITDKYSKL